MTTPIVPSITDEQIIEIERWAGFGGDYLKVKNSAVTGLIARLRATEKDWAKEALAKGFEYVRESDDHYVVASPEDMVNLLRDVIGIDIRMKDGGSYGESVSELKEQVDGLVNTIHTLEEFRKDADRLEWLDGQVEAYGFQGIHEGNRWIVEGPFSSIHRAIDAAMEKSK